MMMNHPSLREARRIFISHDLFHKTSVQEIAEMDLVVVREVYGRFRKLKMEINRWLVWKNRFGPDQLALSSSDVEQLRKLAGKVEMFVEYKGGQYHRVPRTQPEEERQ